MAVQSSFGRRRVAEVFGLGNPFSHGFRVVIEFRSVDLAEAINHPCTVLCHRSVGSLRGVLIHQWLPNHFLRNRGFAWVSWPTTGVPIPARPPSARHVIRTRAAFGWLSSARATR